MATQIYYLSREPSACSPPSNELLRIDADTPAAVVGKLLESGTLPPDWQSMWAHVLVWTSEDGLNRGFATMRLSEA
jgi:hypothetical protein